MRVQLVRRVSRAFLNPETRRFFSTTATTTTTTATIPKRNISRLVAGTRRDITRAKNRCITRRGLATSSQGESNEELLVAYNELVHQGKIEEDKSQKRVIKALQKVHSSLIGYEAPKTSLVDNYLKAQEQKKQKENKKNSLQGLVNDKISLATSIVGGGILRSLKPFLGSSSKPNKAGEEIRLTKLELLSRPDLVAVNGIIYDLDKFMPKHPGGPIVQNVGGTDATQVFIEMHIEAIIKRAPKVLEKYKVGQLVSTDNDDTNAAVEIEQFFPRGLYIWGGPGTGKTFAMDLFFQHAPVEKKRRVHFHQFMIEVHQRQHALKQSGLGNQMFLRIADELKSKVQLLCLDEFMVSDVADAMIVGELFQAIWKSGIVVVATSNREPSELYQNGIQRHLFLPFIHELEKRCKVVRLRSDRDYRFEIMQKNAASKTIAHDRFFMVRPPHQDSNDSFNRLWQAYTATNQVGPRLCELGHRRKMNLDNVCEELDAVKLSFQELCGEVEQPMGVADYIVLSETFDVIFVEDMPQLDFRDLDTVRRWISFVDIMYDEKVLVVVDAHATIDNLLFDHGLDDKELSKTLLAGKVDIMGDEYLAQTVHDLAQPGEVAYHQHADQETLDEIFAFNRMKSRLHEMQGEAFMYQSDALNQHILKENS